MYFSNRIITISKMTTETQNSYLFISQTLSKQEYYAQSGNKNQLLVVIKQVHPDFYLEST